MKGATVIIADEHSAPAETVHPGLFFTQSAEESERRERGSRGKRAVVHGFQVFLQLLNPRSPKNHTIDGRVVKQPVERAVMVGIETIVNLLAPASSDRFFETSSGPQNLRFSGELPGPILHMEDHWQKLRATLHAPGSENDQSNEGGPDRADGCGAMVGELPRLSII
jgi:hypothetical protein